MPLKRISFVQYHNTETPCLQWFQETIQSYFSLYALSAIVGTGRHKQRWSKPLWRELMHCRYDGKPLHEKVILLLCKFPYFLRGARPLEPAVSEPLIDKQKAVTFKIDPLYTVRPCAAEEIERPVHAGIHLKLLRYKTYEPFDAAPKISASALYEDMLEYPVLKHFSSP